jgi:hypothetical protein
VLPPSDGYDPPLEYAWRCIFPSDSECKGNIQRETMQVRVAQRYPLSYPRYLRPPDHRVAMQSAALLKLRSKIRGWRCQLWATGFVKMAS